MVSQSQHRKSVRRLLVIEGGGAKGAYSYGCMKALRDSKVDFVGVAGTSVGALNGLIWSLDAFDIGDDIWQNLSFSRIYPVRLLERFRAPATVRRIVIRSFSALKILGHCLISTLLGYPNPLRPLAAILLAPLITLLVLLAMIPPGLLASHYGEFSWTEPFVQYGVAASLAVLATICWAALLTGSARFQFSLKLWIIGHIAVAWFGGLGFVMDYFFPTNGQRIAFTFLFSVVGLILLVIYWIFVESRLQFRHRLESYLRSSATIFTRQPLINNIRKALESDHFQVPLYVTTARRMEIFDPKINRYTPTTELT